MEKIIKEIQKHQSEISDQFGEYVAVFSDGSVSEILNQSTVPNPSEGDYVRIFKNDNESDILSKIGSLK